MIIAVDLGRKATKKKEKVQFLLSWGQLSKNFQRKIAIIFLPSSYNIRFGCSKEPSQWDGSLEYPQHTFRLSNKKNIFRYAPLSGGLPL